MIPAGPDDSSDESSDSDDENASRDTRPPPWEGLDARVFGRILLVLGIAAGAMYLFVGYLYFSFLTNPTMTEKILDRSGFLEPANPVAEGLNGYAGLCGLYVLSTFLIGAWLGWSLRAVKVKHIVWIKVFTMVTPVLLWIPGLLWPFVRELSLFLPPAMMLFAASSLIFPESPYRRRIVKLCLASIVPMIFGVVFFQGERALGAATMYLALLAMGVCAISLVMMAREEHLNRPGLHGREEQAGMSRPEPKTPLEPLPGHEAPRPQNAGRAQKPARIIIAASIVLSVVFLPPVWVLGTDPDLELYWQVRTGDDTGDMAPFQSTILVEAVVINRGAAKAIGLIELVVRNDIHDFPVGSIDGMEGFGSWIVKKELKIPNNREARHNITISLVHNGEVLETQKMRIPMPNPVLALAAIVVIKAVLDRRRGRR